MIFRQEKYLLGQLYKLFILHRLDMRTLWCQIFRQIGNNKLLLTTMELVQQIQAGQGANLGFIA